MTRLLVTGADGFVGRWLVRAGVAGGLKVVAAVMPDVALPHEWQHGLEGGTLEIVRGDLATATGVAAVAATQPDRVVHLAAVASGAAAQRDPDAAWKVNVDATAQLFAQLARPERPRCIFVSSGEVYGTGHDGAITEGAPVAPSSSYGESKAGAEVAALAAHDGGGLDVVIARPFPHTGPGQRTTFVLPALAARLRVAQREGATSIKAGDLSVVRDFLDVRDVVQAYLLLLDRGVGRECYNVASGVGHRLSECLAMLARLIRVDVEVEADPALARPGDIPVLIGDAGKLYGATGWSPRIPFARTLQDLVNAQAY